MSLETLLPLLREEVSWGFLEEVSIIARVLGVQPADGSTVRMLGQGVGPVFGGVLAQYLGFRSIFWFLVILSVLSLLSILFFLPETIRTVAGNGTVPLHGIYKPWIYYITGQKNAKEDAIPAERKSKVTIKTVFAPLGFLIEKDVFITLFFGAIVYTVWSMVTSSTSALFESFYGLSTLEVGLTFLSNGKQPHTTFQILNLTLTQDSAACLAHTRSAT